MYLMYGRRRRISCLSFPISVSVQEATMIQIDGISPFFSYQKHTPFIVWSAATIQS